MCQKDECRRANAVRIAVILPFLFAVVSGCQKAEQMSLWDRHCAACHDGQTVLNGKVVIDKDQMKMKYKTLDEFTGACSASPSCMNIMKHEEKLFLEAGKDIGIKESRK
jgi:hypothetical protein